MISTNLCDACLDGKGGYCNDPECAMCRSVAPDVPIRDKTVPCECNVLRARIASLESEVERLRARVELAIRHAEGFGACEPSKWLKDLIRILKEALNG
jgi:hypothetical protein